MLKKFTTNFLTILFIFTLNVYASKEDILAQKLINSYPNFLKSYKNNQIIWYDRFAQSFDDKAQNKTFEELLNNSSLKDHFKDKYVSVLNNENYIPKLNEDPGRYRNQIFFEKMYGKTKEEITNNLIEIKWMPKSTNKTIWVSKVNDIDKKFIAISKELDELPNELKKYVNNPSGGFNYRKIANTDRLSTHSFGISIDINVENSHYWLWDKKKNNFTYKNNIPLKIVKIFEKYGFIWGGRWYHYDTMHFEYRPELF